MTTFEFDNPDDLWARVKDLQGMIVVRHKSMMSSQVVDRLEEDERFAGQFSYITSNPYKPGDELDLHTFKIRRKADDPE